MKLLSRTEELILLAIWKLKDNAYCVPILEQVQHFTGKKWTLGNIYIPLHRLEKNGVISSSLGAPSAERGGKSKRFYGVTPLGINSLQEIRKVVSSSWEGLDKTIFEI